MPPGEFIPDPEWVMLGIDQPEGVCVFASRTLSIAELRSALNHVTITKDGESRKNTFEAAWELAVTMDEVYWATGTDYGDAIRRLFEEWSPDASDARGLPMPVPSLTNRERGVGWSKEPRSLPRSS